MTQTSDPTQLEASIEIAAPPARVWSLVTDLPRMREWSPMTARTLVLGRMRVGARFVNLNRKGALLAWPTTGKVVRHSPETDFAFRITENRVVWSYALEPTATGTRVTSRRETPQGISSLSTRLTTSVLGGVPAFEAELAAGMRTTLARLKAAAEG